MKTTLCTTILTLLISLGGTGLAAPLGTAITYHGRLTDGGSPANGLYDMQFILYDALYGGGQQGLVVPKEGLPVTNGLFNVELDFGPNVFNGQARWLEIGVRPGASSGIYTPLVPRQPLTPVPYALYSPQAGNAATATSANNFSGALAGDVAGAQNATSVQRVRGVGVASAVPAPNQFLRFDGAQWSPGAVALATDVSGTLSVANGGTGSGTQNFMDLTTDQTIGGRKLFGPASGPPFAVGNPNKVLNLNADLLDGQDSSAFAATSHNHDTAYWKQGGNAGTGPGPKFLGTVDNQPLEFKVNNQRGLRLEPTTYTDTVNVIGGSARNFVGAGAVGATIGGGGSGNYNSDAMTNRVEASFGTVSGGAQNTIEPFAASSTIGGGDQNTIEFDSYAATIGGGNQNAVKQRGRYATIGGGTGNTIWENTDASTIGGGLQNMIWSNASLATIGGGSKNTIQSNGEFATIPGGFGNSATNYAFAAGYLARANHTGAFVWADSTVAEFASTRADQFCIRAAGGVRIDSPLGVSLDAANSPLITRGYDPFVSGAYAGLGRWGLFMEPHALVLGMPELGGKTVQVAKYQTNGFRTVLATFDQSGNLITSGTVNPSSDRNVKTNFASIECREILARVASLPIETWSYKTDTDIRHIGPVAQDFYTTFGVGSDDKHIATVDADGVALAAIQGLNQIVKEKESAIAALQRQNQSLESRLAALERVVGSLISQKGGEKP